MKSPRRDEPTLAARWEAAGADPELIDLIEREARAVLPRSDDRRARQAWGRVEAALRARRAPRRVWMPALAALTWATVFALAVLVWGRDERPSNAHVERPSIEHVERPSIEHVERPSIEHVERPSIEHVERPSNADLEAPVEIAPGVLLVALQGARIEHASSGEWVLEKGEILVEVSARPDTPLRFRAAGLDAQVVGTVFALGIEDGVGFIRVYDGAVDVRVPGAEPVRVDSATGLVPPRVALEPAHLEGLERWGREASARHQAARGKVTTPPEPKALPSPRAAALRGTTRDIRPRPKQSSAEDPRARSAKADLRASSPEPSRSVERASAPEVAASSAPRTPGMAPKRVASLSELRSYQSARAWLVAKNTERAIPAFRRYLAEYPEGTLRDEAELSLLEALLRAQSPELATEARLWLAKHPHHPRAAEVRAMMERRAP